MALNPQGTPKPIPAALPADTTTPSGRYAAGAPNRATDPNWKGGGSVGAGSLIQAGKDVIHGIIDPPKIDTSAADAERERANQLADSIGGAFGAQHATATADRTQGDASRVQQQDQIADLKAAAAGAVPSAAETQLKTQAGIDAARQYALAKSIRGESAGGALRQAALGAADVAGTTNANAAALRANEQATARGQLTNALTGERQQDLGQQNVDTGYAGTLLGGQLTSQGQGVQMTAAELQAKSAEAAAAAQNKGSLLSAGGAGLASILSDKRSKENVKPADLADALAASLKRQGAGPVVVEAVEGPPKSMADALGEQVHGVTFQYKPGIDAGGPHFGVLADSLEKVIPGVVRRGADGLRRVDTPQLSMANTALVSELAERVKELEGKTRRRS